ncbi:hypothetical protein, partial [Pseudomonas fragi]|uniref:hypothetical protein n=1 Tax=Pseudomonas fragi TaxID=296 RepID=UPI000BDA7EBE
MAKKKTPVETVNLAAEVSTRVDEAELLSERIARYGHAHARSNLMLDHLRDDPSDSSRKAAASLSTCGN